MTKIELVSAVEAKMGCRRGEEAKRAHKTAFASASAAESVIRKATGKTFTRGPKKD